MTATWLAERNHEPRTSTIIYEGTQKYLNAVNVEPNAPMVLKSGISFSSFRTRVHASAVQSDKMTPNLVAAPETLNQSKQSAL